MRRFNMADRDRNQVRGSVNWDATTNLSLQGNVEYTDDNYSNSVYGLQSNKGLMANLEANWTVSENFTANLFYTYEEQRAQSGGLSYGSNSSTASVNGSTVVSGGCFNTVVAKNMNAKIDPCLNWFTDMKDKVNTIGAGFDWKNLASRQAGAHGQRALQRRAHRHRRHRWLVREQPVCRRRQAARRSRRALHPGGRHADREPEVAGSADRRAVRARQAVLDPRVLLVAEAQGDGLCL